MGGRQSTHAQLRAKGDPLIMPFIRARPNFTPIRTPRQLGFRGFDRGMGDAPCPSLSQLQGIVDPSDPCQQFSPSGDTVVFPTGTSSAIPAPTCMPGDSLSQLPSGQWQCSSPAGGLNLGAWLSANPMAIVGLGLAIMVLLLPVAGGRRS